MKSIAFQEGYKGTIEEVVDYTGKPDYTEIPSYYSDNRDIWQEKHAVMEHVRLKYDGDIHAACEDHPAFFAFFYLGFKLRYYQVYMLDMCIQHNLLQALCGRRMGKEQPVSSKVLTKDGFKRMGDMKVGDIVRTPDNGLANVTGIFPQGVKDVYRLTMDDGTTVECGLNHLWKFYTKRQLSYNKEKNKDSFSVKELKDILDYYKKDGNKWVMTKNNYIAIPTTEPLTLGNKKDFLINPYLMGALLGDGSFRDNSIKFTTADAQMFDNMKIPENYHWKKLGDKYSWRLSKTKGKYNQMHKQLKEYNLFDKLSIDKHIPKDYLYTSIDQRKALLKGLMDTDGGIDKNGCIEYSTASKQLAEDVQFLVESLGGKVRSTYKNNSCNGSYRLHIRINFCPFMLDRKIKIYNKRYNGRDKYRYVREIEIIRQEESQCIMIDSEEHLYLTDHFIPTHNTTVYKIYAAWMLWYNKMPTGLFNTTNIIVIAQSGKGSESYIQDIVNYYNIADERYYKLFGVKNFFTRKFPKRSDKAKNTNTMFNLRAPNGNWCSLSAFSPTPKARGEGAGILLLDELAFWDDMVADAQTIYDEVVRPIVTDNPNTKVLIATTPNGATGLSYDLMPIDGHETMYDLIWLPYYYRDDTAYLKGMSQVEKEYRQKGNYKGFRQEYLAEILASSDAFFQPIEVENVFSNPDVPLMRSYDGDCSAGLDFGGHGDKPKSRTVLTVSRIAENGDIQRIWHKRYPLGEDSMLQEDIINMFDNFPGINKFHIDNQGGGSMFYSWVRKTFGYSILDEVSFRREKEIMYRQFQIASFRNQIHSYPDQELKGEMNGFSRKLKPRSKDGTDDLMDSWAMSIKDWINIEEKSPIQVKKINRYSKNDKTFKPSRTRCVYATFKGSQTEKFKRY